MPRSVLRALSRKLRRPPIAWFAAMSLSAPHGARGRAGLEGVLAAAGACGAGAGDVAGLVGTAGAVDGSPAACFAFFFNQPKTMGCCS